MNNMDILFILSSRAAANTAQHAQEIFYYNLRNTHLILYTHTDTEAHHTPAHSAIK